MKNPNKCQFEMIPLQTEISGNLSEWLVKQAQQHQLRGLLAFVDDGIIWGEIRGNRLEVPNNFGVPSLREITLQEARLFGQEGEFLIWKSDKGWQGRIIKDKSERTEQKEYYDQRYLLWGKEVRRISGFIFLREGSRGMQHAPPLPMENLPDHPQFSLTVRHYIEYDPDGQVYVAFSRLVSLNLNSEEGSA